MRATRSSFRVAPEDESGLPLEAIAARLDGTFVAGGFDSHGLAGVGGLTRFEGAKLRHRALLWGMYVRDRARGRGLADALMRVLLAQACTDGIEQVLLTVAADNDRARRLYARWGFSVYGIEPRAVKVERGYLDEALMVCLLGSDGGSTLPAEGTRGAGQVTAAPGTPA